MSRAPKEQVGLLHNQATSHHVGDEICNIQDGIKRLCIMLYCKLGDPDVEILPRFPVSRAVFNGKQNHTDLTPMIGRTGMESKTGVIFHVTIELKDNMD